MGRRYQAEELYEDEYQAEERTRAAVSSVPSYDDQFEDRTRSARESHIALEGLASSAERPRAPRRSFVDAEELLETPARPSFTAPAPERSERRSRIERSEQPRPRQITTPPPPPAPPTPRPGSRHSFVASSEREDFASSVPDAEEVTSFRDRPQSQHPVSSRRASQHPVSSRRASQHPVREATYAPAIESSEIEEIVPMRSKRASMPAPEERSRPVDYNALKRFLFDDVPASSAAAAAMSPEDRSVSMQTPVATLSPRASQLAFRPAMHSIRPDSIRPEIAPAARISHHAFRPQMHSQMPGAVAPVTSSAAPQMAQLANLPTVPDARASHVAFRPPMMTGPQMPPMAAAVHNDSYVNSSWIVPTPPFASNASPLNETGAFKVTLSFVAAAVTAVAALAVMIGAILFIRTEDAPPAPAAAGAKVEAPALPAPAAPPPVKVDAPKADAPKADAQVSTPVVTTPKAETPKKKKVVVAAQPKDTDEEEADAPPPPKKGDKKAEKTAAKAQADKNLERMLADLGEEQLKR